MEMFGAGFGLILGLGITLFTFAIIGVVFWVVYSKLIGPLMKGQKERQRLLMTGVQAQAQVTNLTQTGMLVNNNPQVQITLVVHGPMGPPYQTSVTMVVSMVAIPRVQPGAWVPVRIDQQNPMNVAIDGHM